MGRLAEEKNVAGLLRSWTTYRNEGGTWPLVLCGDGPERTKLQTLAASTPHAADVHFPGLKSSRELLPIYAAAGCFVLPSTREPWGLVVNEAMAAQLPVLVSDRCGCSVDLVVQGENGFTFAPNDEARLAELLATMDAKSVAERVTMGLRSGEIISAYSPQRFGESIASLLPRQRQRSEADLVVEVAS